MRPARVVFVTGTATEVGKTWVGAALLAEARRRGLAVSARKPAQSYEPGGGPLDAEVLAAASGEAVTDVCPAERTYPVPMAPPMAAEALGLAVPSAAGLVAEVEASWPAAGADLGLVEGAGGVASPLAGDADSARLAQLLGVDAAILVADAGLGVINSVRLSAAALSPLRVVVHLNRFDGEVELQQRNLEWLSGRDGFPVTTAVGSLVDAVMAL